jgi:uncharacterized protein (TIGR02145 family)
MKIFLLLFVVLTLNNNLFSQSMIIHQYDGTKDTLSVAVIDSITFLPFQCGLSKVKYSNKIYNTIQMGAQCWFKENLDVGTMITGWPDNNGIIEKYCYNNDPSYCATYGGLYMWDEAMQYVTTEGAQGICPTGWHMPTEAESQALLSSVNNDANALKREDQGTGAGQGTNTSGFSLLLAGAKGYSGGPFQGLGAWMTIWVGKDGSCGYSCVYSIGINSTNSTITLDQGAMPSWALSVRCVKN